MITVRHIINAISEHDQPKAEEFAWEGKRLCDYAREGSVGCVVNGVVVKREEPDWDRIPDDGSFLVFVESEDGSKGFSEILGAVEIVVGIVLLFYAPVAGIGLIIGGAGMLGGALLAPSAAGLQPPTPNNAQPSATYAFDGIGLTVRDGTPIQVVYGEQLVAGQLLCTYRNLEAPQFYAHEWLYMLIGLGEGPIAGIGDPNGVNWTVDKDYLNYNPASDAFRIPDGIRLNGVEAKTFTDIQMCLRMGWTDGNTDVNHQRIMQWFKNTIVEYPQDGRELYSNAEERKFKWITRTPINEIEARVAFPEGVYKTNATGQIVSLDERTPGVTMDVYSEDGSTLIQRLDQPFGGRGTPFWGNNPLFDRFYIGDLPYAKYQIHVYRSSAYPAYDDPNNQDGRVYKDRMYLTAIKETQYGATTYPGIALLGLKIKATTQLSGQPPNVTTIVRGRKVQTISDDWDPTPVYSANPAYICADMLTNPRYGLGKLIKQSDLSPLVDWKNWADFCAASITAVAAGYGQPVRGVGNTGTAGVPTITGTYAGSYSGSVEMRVTAIVPTTSVTFDVTVNPNDGTTAPIISSVMFTDASATSIGDGLYAALADDPSISTAMFRVGDLWRFYITTAVSEPRMEFNGVFDTQRAGWEVASQVAAIGRSMLIKRGAYIVPKIEQQKAASQLFSEGNIKTSDGKKSSVGVKWINPLDRANRILVNFQNAKNYWAKDIAPASLPGLDESTGTIIEKSVDAMPGITSPYQAARYATFLLRSEQSNIKLISFDTSLEGMAVEPGDVFYLTADAIGWSDGGRLAGVDGSGNATLDQAVEFEADVVYTYLERSSVDDSIASKDFSMPAGKTAQLPFPPQISPADAAGATGRIFFVGKKFRADQKFFCLSTSWKNRGFDRSITAIIYDPMVFTDDALEFPAAAFLPAPGAKAVTATSPGVVETIAQSNAIDIPLSLLTFAWTAAAGAASYRVVQRVLGSDKWGIMGETDDVAFAWTVNFALGTPLEIGVVTVTDDGQTTADADIPVVEYIIRRATSGTVLVAFPAKVANVDWTASADNVWTLGWDAVTLDTDGNALAPDGYEVRCGNFQGGVTVYRGTALSVDLTLPNVATRFHVRAFKTQGGRDYYSPETSFKDGAPANKSGYATNVISEWIDLSDRDFFDAFGNASAIPWAFVLPVGFATSLDVWPGEFAALQTSINQTMEIVTGNIDMGAATLVRVGVGAWVAPYWVDPGNLLFMTMQQFSPMGMVNVEYLNWSLALEYSTDGTTFYSLDAKAAMGLADLIVTARYLRVRFRGDAAADVTSSEPEEQTRRARVMLEKLAISVDTA